MKRFLIFSLYLWQVYGLAIAEAPNHIPLEKDRFVDFLDLSDELRQRPLSEPYVSMSLSSANIANPKTNVYGDQDIFHQWGHLCIATLFESFKRDMFQSDRLEDIVDFIAHMRSSSAYEQGSDGPENFALKRRIYGTLTTLMDVPHRETWARYFFEDEEELAEYWLSGRGLLTFHGSIFDSAATFGEEQILLLDPQRQYIQTLQQAYDAIFPEEEMISNAYLSMLGVLTGKFHKITAQGLKQNYIDKSLAGKAIIMHADPSYFPAVFQFMAEVLDELIRGYQTLPGERIFDLIAASHWALAGITPHVRGGGTVAEWYAATLFTIFYPHKFRSWGAYEPWSMAVTLGVKEFIKRYRESLVFADDGFK